MPDIDKKLNPQKPDTSAQDAHNRYLKIKKRAPTGEGRAYVHAKEVLVSVPYMHRGWETAKVILSLPNEQKSKKGEVITLAKIARIEMHNGNVIDKIEHERTVHFAYKGMLGYMSFRWPYADIGTTYIEAGRTVRKSRIFRAVIGQYTFFIENNHIEKVKDSVTNTEFPFDDSAKKYYKEQYFDENGKEVKVP